MDVEGTSDQARGPRDWERAPARGAPPGRDRPGSPSTRGALAFSSTRSGTTAREAAGPAAGRGPQVRDVEALGLDWLEGPENRAGGKPRAGGPPPLRTEAWSCCPFDVRVFLPAPSVTGRSCAGTRADGHAHPQSCSRAPAPGPQASTFTFRRPRGLCASEPRPGAAQLALPRAEAEAGRLCLGRGAQRKTGQLGCASGLRGAQDRALGGPR